MSSNKQQHRQLIVVGGPTASGKTAVAIELAKHFDTEIVSCDSRQFFRELHIGTAKPTAAELAAVPHHFINSLSITDTYSVGAYEQDALELLTQLFEKQDRVLLVGGSGLYIQAVCEGLDQFPAVSEEIRIAVEREYREKGLRYLQKMLQKVDPIYYEAVDQQNPRRLMRALSVYRASGKAFSSFRRQAKTTRPFQIIYLRLEWERALLYERINRRVDWMIAAGLEAEALELLPYQHLTALQTVGYQEFFDYFNGKIDRPEAIRLIKRNTRRYAKRQMTWFRRSEHWQGFHPTELEQMIDYIEHYG
ncbi:MAG: tRNA (adenosine(37)-N6)-dimethylallyltransferase MiaA [Bacteroidota bacterium]